MTVQMTTAMPAGNAVHILLAPPRGAVSWRVLRRPADAFDGPDDPRATVIADQWTDNAVMDIDGLLNGQTYFYRVYYRDERGDWLPTVGETRAQPLATYRGDDLDVQTLVRSRVDLGIKAEIAAGRLKPSSNGGIDVTFAPFALPDTVAFPTISVHLDTDASGERALGEVITPDFRRQDGDWTQAEGWYSRVALNIVATTDNPNVRLALRRAIKRVIQANMPIFDAKGLLLIDFQQRDTEDTEHYNVPLYFSLGSFSCLAPAFVADDVADIEDVDVQHTPY